MSADADVPVASEADAAPAEQVLHADLMPGDAEVLAPAPVASDEAGQAAPMVEEIGAMERKSAEPEAPPEPPPDAGDLPPAQLRSVVEALLFVSSRPLTPARLANCLPGTSPHYLDGFLLGMAARFDAEHRGWELRREANGWRLLTRPEFHPWVRQLDRRELPTRLTKGAVETLAVVAYKQPVTRGVIEDIRGVQAAPVLRQLMDLRLVAVVGRDESVLGRPLLYGTTDQFLQRFGLGSLDDLPKSHEFGS